MAATEYDFASTRTQLLKRAFRQVGALALGESLSADQEEQGVQVLNAVVKSWMARQTHLWQIQTFTQALTSSVVSYLLPTDPAFACVDSGWLRNSEGIDTKLTRINLGEYNDIEDKSVEGVSTHFTVSNTRVFLHPVPSSADYTFIGQGVVFLKDFDSASTKPEQLSLWEDALTYSVASGLAPEYGLPIGERQDLMARAESLYRIAKNFNQNVSDTCRTRGAFG